MPALKHVTFLLALGATLSAQNADAGFPACTMSNTVLGTGSDPVNYVRMKLRADGRPAIVFSTDVHNNSALYFYDCASPVCDSDNVVTLDFSSNYFGAPGIVIRSDGRPLISASHYGGLRLYDCADAGCGSFADIDILPVGSAILADLPLTLQTNGNPLLLYRDSAIGARPGWLIAHFCADAACARGSEQVLAQPPEQSQFDGLALALDKQGVPIASYLTTQGPSNVYGYDIGVCSGNPACSVVTSTQIAAPVASFQPTLTALAVRSDGRPLALQNLTDTFALLDCTTSACTAATRRSLPANAVGFPLGLGLLSGDAPAFALFGTATVGAFACADATCSNGSEVAIASAQQGVLDGDFALDSAMLPAVAYIDSAARNLAFARCSLPDPIFANGFE
ncbi:MAG: hypothetical protein JSS28_01420 [Proteobacteria bacterium]|nr:hypothetical protein [Pseudomonadota bacterium]